MFGFLFQMILLFIILIGMALYLRSMLVFIVIAELIVITLIQLFTLAIEMKEYYFLIISSILFIFIFILLQRNRLNGNQINSLFIFLIFYVNWYYLTFYLTNLVN